MVSSQDCIVVLTYIRMTAATLGGLARIAPLYRVLQDRIRIRRHWTWVEQVVVVYSFPILMNVDAERCCNCVAMCTHDCSMLEYTTYSLIGLFTAADF